MGTGRDGLQALTAATAPPPDNIAGRVLRDRAGDLADNFRHLQHLAESGCCPSMPQTHHRYPRPKEVITHLFPWLPSSCTRHHLHEGLRTASHAISQD